MGLYIYIYIYIYTYIYRPSVFASCASPWSGCAFLFITFYKDLLGAHLALGHGAVAHRFLVLADHLLVVALEGPAHRGKTNETGKK